jgi:hypothetical protein
VLSSSSQFSSPFRERKTLSLASRTTHCAVYTNYTSGGGGGILVNGGEAQQWEYLLGRKIQTQPGNLLLFTKKTAASESFSPVDILTVGLPPRLPGSHLLLHWYSWYKQRSGLFWRQVTRSFAP